MAEEKLINVFNELNGIDLRGKTDEKMGLTYLNWAWAWTILKQRYASVEQKIYTHPLKFTETTETVDPSGYKKTVTVEHEEEINYFTDGHTCYVKVGVVIDGHEEIVTLPIMNMKNQSINVGSVTSVDVNRAQQRAFVKAAAMHGLGLYIYAGEKEPEAEPVVINWNDLTKKADAIKNVPAEEMSRFNEHLAMVTEMVSKYANDFGDQIVKYVKTQTDTKITAMTPDKFVELYRIETFLRGIKEALGE